MKVAAQTRANATEQSEDLFADIGGTPLTDAQADAIEGDFIYGGVCAWVLSIVGFALLGRAMAVNGVFGIPYNIGKRRR